MGTESIGLSAMASIIQALAAAKADSLIEYTKPLRVEPIVLVDQDCVHYDEIGEVMQSLLSIFSGYYLMALTLSTQIGNISVMGKLGPLNPSRDPVTEMGVSGMKLLTLESYDYSLPFHGEEQRRPVFESFYDPAISKDDPTTRLGGADIHKDKLGVPEKVGDLGEAISKSANLSVGKILSVEITDGRCRMNIPVNVRLLTNIIPSSSLVNVLTPGGADKSWKARWHSWKAGRLSSIRDMIFCQDLIDEHRKKMMDDNTGVYGQVVDRKRKNQLSAIMSGMPSVATASNMVVMSLETLEKIQAELSIDFNNFDNRQKFFSETSLMIIAVIDRQWSFITFYHRSIPETTKVSARDLKSANKSGVDVKDVLNAYSLGHGPSL